MAHYFPLSVVGLALALGFLLLKLLRLKVLVKWVMTGITTDFRVNTIKTGFYLPYDYTKTAYYCDLS